MEENSKINENIAEDITIDSSIENIYLPSGKALSLTETYLITASEKSRFVVLLGAAGCGKTAICISIYSHFLEGKFEDKYYFAGSKTLATFEEYAYLTRPVSGGNMPTHDRTKKGTQSVLHLRLYEPLKNSYTNCLIADFSGEDYENVICNTDYAKDEFLIIKSATVLVVILDGEKMCKASTRVSEIQKSINLLRTFYDSNLISSSISIIIVVSKFDLVEKANVVNWQELIIGNFSQQLPSLKDRFIIKAVAPLSRYTDIVNVGYGITNFFDEVVQQDNRKIINIKLPATDSQFEMWGRKVLYNDN